MPKAKKKIVKKAPKKKITKTIQKVPKTVAAKAEESQEKKVSLSKFTCELLIQNKFTDEEIAEKLQEQFTKLKHVDTKAVQYYRNKINAGKMESVGFPKPEEFIERIGTPTRKAVKPKITEKEALAQKNAKKKVVKKKVVKKKAK